MKKAKIRFIKVYDGWFASTFDGAKIKSYTVDGGLVLTIDFTDGSKIVTTCKFLVDIEYTNEN